MKTGDVVLVRFFGEVIEPRVLVQVTENRYVIF